MKGQSAFLGDGFEIDEDRVILRPKELKLKASAVKPDKAIQRGDVVVVQVEYRFGSALIGSDEQDEFGNFTENPDQVFRATPILESVQIVDYRSRAERDAAWAEQHGAPKAS